MTGNKPPRSRVRPGVRLPLVYAPLITVAACSGHEPRAHPSAAPAAVLDASPGRDASSAAAARAGATVETDLGPCDGSPRPLGPGLTLERWPVDAVPAIPLAPCVDLVRADLSLLRLRLVTASRDGAARPATTWAADLDLVAAINAGMFLDGGRSVGMLVDGDHVDQPRDHGKLGGYLAFAPRTAGAPPVVIGGRDCPGFDLAALRRRYRTVVQSYRLLGCDGQALAWADPKAYSAAAIAIDRAGRVVLVHARAPFLMRDLSAALARPDLGLVGALFVEGGPEATLVVTGPRPLVRVGSYETGFVENDGNHEAWALPNLVALVRAPPR